MTQTYKETRKLWTPGVPRAEVRLHNHFLAEVRDAKSGKLVQRAEAQNVVTNTGRNYLADMRTFYAGAGPDSGFMASCLIGSGVTAPAVTDDRLANRVAWAGQATEGQVGAYVKGVADPATQTWWNRRKYQFSELVANANLTEVGLYSGPRNNGLSGDETDATTLRNCLTRALFRDANGSPITVTKTSSQILNITATVHLMRGAVDQNMVLPDQFFTEMAFNRIWREQDWYLGDGGAVAPTNTDTVLKGVQLATKNSSGITQWMWTDMGWLRDWTGVNRPTNKLGVSPFSMDWELNEANGIFSEVVCRIRANDGVTYATLVRLVFPCGAVAGVSYTKTNQVKLRQYFEIIW